MAWFVEKRGTGKVVEKYVYSGVYCKYQLDIIRIN